MKFGMPDRLSSGGGFCMETPHESSVSCGGLARLRHGCKGNTRQGESEGYFYRKWPVSCLG